MIFRFRLLDNSSQLPSNILLSRQSAAIPQFSPVENQIAGMSIEEEGSQPAESGGVSTTMAFQRQFPQRPPQQMAVGSNLVDKIIIIKFYGNKFIYDT
jgi:hypothetical protein